jgi:hypothetical protein
VRECEEAIGANGASTEETPIFQHRGITDRRCFATFANRTPAARMAGSAYLSATRSTTPPNIALATGLRAGWGGLGGGDGFLAGHPTSPP